MFKIITILLERKKIIYRNPNFSKFAKNSGWLIFDKIIRMLLGLFVGAWVARYLGPEKYGQLAYVIAFIALFRAITILGLDGIIVREISKNSHDSGVLLGTTLVARFAVSIISWGLSILCMGLLNGWNHSSLILTMIVGSTIFFQVGETIDLWYQSQSQSKKTVLVKSSAYIFSNVAKVICIFSEASLTVFASIMAFESFLISVGLIITFKRYPCGNQLSYSLKKTISLLQESWPFIISALSIIIYMRIDQIMIKELLGDSELGVYAAVISISSLWSFLPTTLFVSLAPFVAKAKKNNQADYLILISKIFRFFSILGWLVCIPIAFFANDIIFILFGDSYSEGGDVLSVVIFTNLFINMGMAHSLWILNEGQSKLSLYKTIIGAVVCIFFNYWLIPIYGIMGAAISGVFAQLSSTILSNIILCPKIFVLQVKSILLIKHKVY